MGIIMRSSELFLPLIVSVIAIVIRFMKSANIKHRNVSTVFTITNDLRLFVAFHSTRFDVVAKLQVMNCGGDSFMDTRMLGFRLVVQKYAEPFFTVHKSHVQSFR